MSEEIKEQPGENENEIHLLDYLIVLAKRKKLILGITLSVAVLTTIFTLFMPNMYWGRTTILLPQSANAPMWLRILNDYTGGGSLSSGIEDPQLYTQFIYTGPVLDKIIDKFGLTEYYEEQYGNIETKKDLRDALMSSVTSEFVLPEGQGRVLGSQTSRLMMISVIDKDPQKAADMANAFVEALRDFLKDIAITQAAQRRLFFEEQVHKVKEDLIRSEEAMQKFQEKTGVFKVEAQATAVIEGIAKLRAEVAAKEVEMSVMKTYSTQNNPDLLKVAETIKGLKTEIAKLEQKGGNSPDSLMPTGRMAAVGTDYIRNMRDLKFNETLYELMMKQYEYAKLEEAGNPAMIQVLEKAYPSQERAGPERKKKIAITTGTALLFSVFLAFAMEFLERQKSWSPENRERMERLKGYLSFRRK